MNEQIVRIRQLETYNEVADNLDYWLSKTPTERVDAVDYLRYQCHGNLLRLQRSARIIQLPQS